MNARTAGSSGNENMSYLFPLGHALLVLASIGVLVLFDAEGIFIFFGYAPAWLAVVALTAWGVLAAGRPGYPSTRTQALLFLALTTTSLLALSVLPWVPPPAAGRHFIMTADSIVAGMTLPEVRNRLAHFDPHPFEKDPGSVTFGYQSEKGTIDTLMITLMADGKVTGDRFSADLGVQLSHERLPSRVLEGWAAARFDLVER